MAKATDEIEVLKVTITELIERVARFEASPSIMKLVADDESRARDLAFAMERDRIAQEHRAQQREADLAAARARLDANGGWVEVRAANSADPSCTGVPITVGEPFGALVNPMPANTPRATVRTGAARGELLVTPGATIAIVRKSELDVRCQWDTKLRAVVSRGELVVMPVADETALKRELDLIKLERIAAK